MTKFAIAIIDVHRVEPEAQQLDSFAVWYTSINELERRVCVYMQRQPWFQTCPPDKWLICTKADTQYVPSSFKAIEPAPIMFLLALSTGPSFPWRPTFEAIDFSRATSEEKHEDLVEFVGFLHTSTELKFDRPYCYFRQKGADIELVHTAPVGTEVNMHLGVQWTESTEQRLPRLHFGTLLGSAKRVELTTPIPLIENVIFDNLLPLFRAVDFNDETVWFGPNALWFTVPHNDSGIQRVVAYVPLLRVATSPHTLARPTWTDVDAGIGAIGIDAHNNMILEFVPPSGTKEHYAVASATWRPCVCTMEFSHIGLQGIGEHVYVVRTNEKGHGSIVGRLMVDHTAYPEP